MVRMRALVGIAIVCAITATCGILAWQLSIEKVRSRQQVELLHSKDIRIAEIDRARARLEREVDRLSGKAKAAEAPKRLPPSTAASEPSETTVPERVRLRWNLPGWRAMQRAQQKLHVWRSYTPLTRQLGLSAKDADRFIDLLVAQRERGNDMWQQNPPADRASLKQKQLDMKRDEEAEIEAYLGADRIPTYREYQRTLGARMSVSRLGEQLGALGVPLDADQREKLITIITEEFERIPTPELASGEETLDEFKRRLDWMDDCYRRVRERAAGALSSQQLKFLSDQQELQAATRHSALEMQKQALLAGLSTGGGFWYPAE